MAYVGDPFRHDLFVSYSHGDDGSGHGLLQPWSAAFCDALKTELRVDRRFREALSVFLDSEFRPGQGVDPMSGLNPQLQASVEATALLVVLMSPDYLASRWCAQERDWWHARQEALGLPAEGRVAVVRIWPTPAEDWPVSLCDAQGDPLLGFPFHDDEAGAARPLGWTDQYDNFGPAFKKAMVGLAGRLSAKLDELKEQVESLHRESQEAARLQGDQGQTIYLHGRLDPERHWERAAMILADSGYAVLPGDPDPDTADPATRLDLRERRVETLGNCDALLLLGTADGRALDADLVAVGRHDRHSARARSNRLLPCGVLDMVGAPLATDVRRRTARNLQTDWLDATRESWTRQVRNWLADKGAQVAQLP
ncbi:MAG: toll/interleukin-1 receptor domain-containing protein [Rhodocyclaceae bacterium]|nr:toll/interleukin-1 receptor domain-containing protein [Rhodocyclaceae bacterium]